MHKAIFEKYLADKAELLDRVTVHPRTLPVHPSKDMIVSIIGPRRTGKTFLFYGLARSWREKGCLYVNFEDIELEGATPKDILELPQLYEETYGKPPALVLFDEIQAVAGWERAVRQLFEEKRFSILVTGSSSKLLSKEIATHLRGRSITHLLLPLSFREYLEFRGWAAQHPRSSSNEALLRRHLDDYITFGGLPDVVMAPESKAKFLESYLDLVVYKDVVERHGIRNIQALNAMIRGIISSFSQPYSVHKLYKTLRSQGMGTSKKTLYSYFGYLQDSLFAFPVWKYSPSIRKTMLTIPKVYLADVGVALARMGEEKGRAMENIVLLELVRRKDLDPEMGIYYWSDGRREADFVITGRRGPTAIIQVAYLLTADNKARENGGLIAASRDLACKNLYLITWNEERVERVEGRTIRTLPLYKWLLGEIKGP